MPTLYQDLESEEKALTKSPPTDLVDFATDPSFRLFRTQGFRGVFGREDRQRAAIDLNGYRQAGRRIQRHDNQVSPCKGVTIIDEGFEVRVTNRCSFDNGLDIVSLQEGPNSPGPASLASLIIPHSVKSDLETDRIT